MNATEQKQFNEYKRNLNLQAAQGQISKLEYNFIDATADKATLRRACQDANSLKLGAICVLPCFVKACVGFLGGDPQTSLIACISYPHGADTTEIKVAAVKRAIKEGVDEVEVSAPVAFVKEGNWGYVKREFKKLKSAVKKRGLRINIQSKLLTPAEITKLSTIAADCGITSLCMASYGNAEPEGETLMRIHSAVKDRCTIKVENITGFTEMNTAVNLGAGILGSKNAVEIAKHIIEALQ